MIINRHVETFVISTSIFVFPLSKGAFRLMHVVIPFILFWTILMCLLFRKKKNPIAEPCLHIKPAKSHVLHLQIFIDAIFRALSAQAWLFNPTKWDFRCGDKSLIHANHSHLQLLSHSPDLTQVLRVKVAWERTCWLVIAGTLMKPPKEINGKNIYEESKIQDGVYSR